MDLSKVTEPQIVNDHKSTAAKSKVVSETIDLTTLRRELLACRQARSALEAQLAEKEPSEEELVEMGKIGYSYYSRDVILINQKVCELRPFRDNYGNH